LHWPTRQIFLVAALPVLIASLAALCISFLRRAPEGEQALQTGASLP
jgi:hypothetical protein